MTTARKDSAIVKQFPEDQNLDELVRDFKQDSIALRHGNGRDLVEEEISFEEYEEGDVGYEEDQEYYESDDCSEDDENDGGFQSYEDWKERELSRAPPRGLQDRPEADRSKDKALNELIQSIKQDSIDLGFGGLTETATMEESNGGREVEKEIQENDPRPFRPANGRSATPYYNLHPLSVRQPASVHPVPQDPPALWPTGQQRLPHFVPFVPLAAQAYLAQSGTQATLPPLVPSGPFTTPGSPHRPLPTRSVSTANPSLPSLPSPRPTQRVAAQVPTLTPAQPGPAPPSPVQATHYAGPSRRLKPKTRLASNSTPRLPNGTIDFEVKTCLHEMKRDGSEFDFNGNHNGNQKCARVLKRLYPHKFPDRISVPVLADRLQQTWYARSDRPGRKQTREWKRVVEMRDGDEALRRALRGRIRGTGIR